MNRQIVTYSVIVTLVLIFIIRVQLFAQILIQDNTTPEQLVSTILGDGVYFENVTYTGINISSGSFTNGNSTELGIDEGIILCTGDVSQIPGPNEECDLSTILNTPGNSLLTSISNAPMTCDATILEFDFVPEYDSLKFQYVFGSDAYSDLISLSDVFGLFITGPNPIGGYYTNENIAIVPGTTGISIQTETINNGDAPCNVPPTAGPCINCNYFWDNSNGINLEYDGFTVALTSNIVVIPCESYHVFIGIADAGTFGFWDSGVFIESNDYYSPAIDIFLSPDSSGNNLSLVEGCNISDIVFKLPNPDYSPVSVYFDFSQSTANPEAWPDGDFEETIPSEVFFEEGQDSLTIHITPVNDGLPEGEELLKIIVEYTLTCMPKYDTIEIIISDYIDMDTQTRPDTAICQGDDLELWVNVENGIPDYTFEWEGLPYTNDTITVNPNISTWYYVNVIDNCQDTVTDSIYVEVITAPEVSLGADTTICTGNEVILQPISGNFLSCLWSTGDTTTSITVNQPGNYTLSVTNQCGEAEDEIMIGQWPYPNPDLGPDLYLCFGETEVLNAAFGFVSYTWHDNSTDDYYIVTQSGIYTVTVEDINGCLGSDTVFAVVGGIVQLEDSLTFCEGDSTTIHAGSGFNTYSWNTGQTGIDSITVNEEGWYKVNASYVFGCPSEDSTFVEALSVPEAEISGSDLLCEGDTLWLIAPEGKYAYYWNDEQGSEEYMVTSGGTYNLKMINACGEDEESKVVQLSPLPMVDLGEDKLLLPGESVTLDAGNFQAFIWNNDPGQTGQYYTIAYEDIQELDSIWVEVFDGFCKNSDDIIIEVFSVDVPNVITPNGDGFNDRFMPGEGWNGISNHTIMVFNRWGEKVWESSDFSSGWDGKNNGRLVANGTYFWILEVWYGKKDIKKVYKGSLTVLGSDN